MAEAKSSNAYARSDSRPPTTMLPKDSDTLHETCMSQPDRLIIVKQSSTAQAVHDLSLRVHDLMRESGPKFGTA